MKRGMCVVLLVACVLVLAGCGVNVSQGVVGRVKTRSGWGKEVLYSGRHACWGFDEMFVCDVTEKTYEEKMDILIGGKVNLTITIATRCRLDQTDPEAIKGVFERIMADGESRKWHSMITHKALYETYVKPEVGRAPQEVFGGETDPQVVMDNKVELAAKLRKMIVDETSKTPMKVDMVNVTNWDWPKSLTAAQEALAGMQLEEKRRMAKVAADLKEADGELKVAMAEKLIEMKKAEAVAESINIIKDALKGNPEYLQWHTVRAMSEAARGPNNAFILFPYNMPGIDTEGMLSNAQLKQMLSKK